jgi:hypothetical protein
MMGWDSAMAAGLDAQFAEKAKRLIRREMDRLGMTYGTLADALGALGMPDMDEAILRGRLSRGKFSASFMLTCLEAMGTKSLDLE